MIRVNLLPVREARRQAGLRQQAMILAVSAGVGLLVCVFLQVSFAAKQNAQLRQIASAKAELIGYVHTGVLRRKTRSHRNKLFGVGVRRSASG